MLGMYTNREKVALLFILPKNGFPPEARRHDVLQLSSLVALCCIMHLHIRMPVEYFDIHSVSD